MSETNNSIPRATVDAQELLAIVRRLAAELRPGAAEVDTLGLDDSLERDFGLDSLARTELLARVERVCDSRVDEKALMAAETPRDLLRLAGKAEAPARLARVAAAPVPGSARTVASHRPPECAATLMDLIDWHVAAHGDEPYAAIAGADELSYRSILMGALSVAAGLTQQGLGAGERVALMLPTGREFFEVFFGALYAGCVPVPLYPPARLSQIEDHMRRSAGILANAEATILVTLPPAKPLLRLLHAQCPSLRRILAATDLHAVGNLTSVVRRGGPTTSPFYNTRREVQATPKG